jgi:hypothetical protein
MRRLDTPKVYHRPASRTLPAFGREPVKSRSPGADAAGMSPLSADLVWFLIALIMAWLVVGCLKAIGYGYYNAVLWHNLKIQVHKLQIEQKRRLRELDDPAPIGNLAPGESDVIIVEPVDDEAAPRAPVAETPPAEAA